MWIARTPFSQSMNEAMMPCLPDASELNIHDHPHTVTRPSVLNQAFLGYLTMYQFYFYCDASREAQRGLISSEILLFGSLQTPIKHRMPSHAASRIRK